MQNRAQFRAPHSIQEDNNFGLFDLIFQLKAYKFNKIRMLLYIEHESSEVSYKKHK